MNRRIVLITELIAPYRIPVFNALARQAGTDLHVIFLAETDTTLRKWRIYNQEICFSHEVLASWRLRTGRGSLLLNHGLQSALKAAAVDVIICGGYNYPASWGALRWARRQNVPFILWSESNLEDERAGNAAVEYLKRYFATSCSAFVVPGKKSFAYLCSLGVNEQVIFTAPNAVDNLFFRAHADSARAHDTEHRREWGLPERFLLCVARLVPEKGVFDLLEAYSELEKCLRNEIGLVFAGDGPARAQLAKRAQNIRPGTIVFPGFMQREELAILYGLAEALVLPTHSDPWGLVVNEAMACGLPVVVTNVAGCSADLVESEWNGFVVPPKDPERLKTAIDRLLQRAELRKQMGEHSSERIRNYSPEACAAGLASAAFSVGRRVPCTR